MDSNTQEKKDIFDKIMSVKPFNILEPFYKKHKEVLLYLFFGGLTTVVGVIFFMIPSKALDLKNIKVFGITIDTTTQVANIISWIIAVTFAYITNRIWVFTDKAHDKAGMIKECLSFYGGRLFTLVVENLLLNLCTVTIGLSDLIAKILVSIVTIILNYVISKLIVFRKKPEDNTAQA